jgi:hypothetical protein
MIGSDLPAIRAQLLLRRTVAPILPVLTYVGSCFLAILISLANITAQLSPVRSYLMAICPQFPAFSGCKPTRISILCYCDRRQSGQ